MWNYTDKVMDHFLHPRNVGEIENPDGVGEVGNAACGDALKLTFKLDKEGRIEDVKFKTFGCASAIASSSALTEIIKGKTLDEAARVTNQDIAEVLGGLPEAKMHCSVMGMEALQAAISHYRGEKSPFEKDEDHEGRIVCKCFGVTDVKILKVAKENQLHKAEDVTHYCKAGGACGDCRDQIQEILDQEKGVRRPLDEIKPVRKAMSNIERMQKVMKVIDEDIRPRLAQDGGNIELVDVDGRTVTVAMRGACASCRASQLTIKELVEKTLREQVDPEITVVEA